jgi:hypothetical protein
MDGDFYLEQKIQKDLAKKDKRKKAKMKVSGKSVFQLKKMISKKHRNLSVK